MQSNACELVDQRSCPRDPSYVEATVLFYTDLGSRVVKSRAGASLGSQGLIENAIDILGKMPEFRRQRGKIYVDRNILPSASGRKLPLTQMWGKFYKAPH